MYKTSEQRRQWRCHSCPSHTHHYYTLYLSDVHRISILLSRQSLLSMYCVCAMVGRSALVGLWLQNVCVATETCPKKNRLPPSAMLLDTSFPECIYIRKIQRAIWRRPCLRSQAQHCVHHHRPSRVLTFIILFFGKIYKPYTQLGYKTLSVVSRGRLEQLQQQHDQLKIGSTDRMNHTTTLYSAIILSMNTKPEF